MVFGIRYSNTSEPILNLVDSPDTKGRFGFYLGTVEKNNMFLIGADYDSRKFQSASSFYSRRLTVNIGYRYLFLPVDKSNAMKILPFVGLSYYRSFSKVEADSTLLSPARVSYYKDISNDSGGWISVGADYHLAPVFGLGCEAGLMYSRATSKALGYQTKIGEYKTFIAILINFYM